MFVINSRNIELQKLIISKHTIYDKGNSCSGYFMFLISFYTISFIIIIAIIKLKKTLSIIKKYENVAHDIILSEISQIMLLSYEILL